MSGSGQKYTMIFLNSKAYSSGKRKSMNFSDAQRLPGHTVKMGGKATRVGISYSQP
jgi:hypothetical protein